MFILQRNIVSENFDTQRAETSTVQKKITDLKNEIGTIIVWIWSEAFDTINHELLIAKLYVHGFSENSLALISSNLSYQ